jgi:1-aminocyclopropane-1-carboxylate deaminase
MATILKQEPYIQPLNENWYKPYVAGVSMLRLDVLHPIISGNKWYKLKHNIQYAQEHGYKSILTFGGAYSNHLIATAAAANISGMNSIGMVRGNYAEHAMTTTLQACVDDGMQLVFASREEYARKNDGDWLEELGSKYPGAFIVPEGGANGQGRAGAEEIAHYIPKQFTHVCVSVGTGTTFAGLRNAVHAEQMVYGYVPMKGGRYMAEEMQPYLIKNKSWKIFDEWHFGGFGKWNNDLVASMNEFYNINNIPLDIVYTSKMMYGLQQQLKQGVFPADAHILCVHTGGLQGNTSVQHLLQY